MYKILKYFEKRQPHACDYRMHEAARIYPERPDLKKKNSILFSFSCLLSALSQSGIIIDHGRSL